MENKVASILQRSTAYVLQLLNIIQHDQVNIIYDFGNVVIWDITH
jgi:hypothetical protein